MISEFNRRVTIRKYSFAQDDGGGNVKSLQTSYPIWAKVEPTAGNKTLDNAQIAYTKTFKLKVRWEQSRILDHTDEIVYNDNLLVIQNITKEVEGRTNFLNIDTYTTNEKLVVVTFTADWGWSQTKFTLDMVADFDYQGSGTFKPGDDIRAEYGLAPDDNYLIVRYPKTEAVKTTWFNTNFNYGQIPDQVFMPPYTDANYVYIWTRVQPALGDSQQIIYG